MDIPEIQAAVDTNFFKVLKGIRVYSSAVSSSYRTPNDPWSEDFIKSYDEFEGHFKNNTYNDLLEDLNEGAQTIMTFDEQEKLSQELTDIIKNVSMETIKIEPIDFTAIINLNDKLEPLNIKKNDPPLQIDEPCPICLSDEIDEGAVTVCKHKFCLECIKNWIDKNKFVISFIIWI